MKLKNLKIHNFVGVSSAEVTFSKPVSLFVGRNNQGKSTVKDAVEFALTGKCRAMKFKNDVVNIIQGKDGMMTELAYLDDSGADVKAKRSKSTVGVNTDDRAVLHYCLNPADFMVLPAKERAKILAEVLGGGMDDVTKNAIAKHIGNIDETVLSEVKGSGVNILDVDAFRKEIVEIRRSYKRLRDDLPDKAPLLGDYDLDDGYDLTESVAVDREAVKALAERIANGTQLLADAKMMVHTQAEIADLEKAIKQIESDRKEVPKMPRGVSKKKLDDAPLYILILEAMLTETNNKEGGGECFCPICEQTSGDQYITRLYNKITGWFEKYQSIVQERAEAEDQNRRADSERDIKSKLLEEAMAKLVTVKIPEGGEDLLAQLQTERDQAQARIANYRRYEIDTTTFEKAGQKREALEGLVQECNRIDEALKDGGPVKAAIAAGGRTLPINQALLEQWGMHELSWTDSGEITLGDVPIEYASASEQYRAGCIMGLALGDVSGIGIAALDGFEILDNPNANRFMGVVEECKLNNVLICNSSDKDYSQVDSPEWLEIFKVEGGKVTRL